MARRNVPRADDSCVLSRVVERDGLRLEVWSCSDPSPPIRSTRQPVRRAADLAQAFWPGCESAWHDQVVVRDEELGRPFVTPGQAQFVVYSGGSVA
ncbi:MAG: hypothetical protein H6Q88_616 [Anaeromyxobacteraceae bacterium]|jgi:hypothetical protein|nr:hypothetical protein [Anaeromyxobacteraceae bacterium]